MLRNLNQILRPAQHENYAVGCFNVFGYEDALAVVRAAENLQTSVILAINLDMSQFMPLEHIAAMLLPLAESSTVPVCLHLDHTYEIDAVKRAIDCGFSSVMYDCSQKPIEDNIRGIQDVVAYAKSNQVSVEAEVGSVPYASGRDYIKSELSNIEEIIAMEKQAKPDAIAISVGNVHRIEQGFVDIDFQHFENIRQSVSTPLVIHGTSGIKPGDIKQLSKSGISKFNIGTCLRQRFGNTLRTTLNKDANLFDRLSIMKHVIPEVQDEAEQMIALLSS